MDIKDLNKSQLILLALLLSFVTSIATGITTVTLIQQAPDSVTVPITKVVRQTVEKIVPVDNTPDVPVLSDDDKKLLEELREMKNLSITILEKNEEEMLPVASGFLIGENVAIINTEAFDYSEEKTYYIKSISGEQKIVSKEDREGYIVLISEKTKEETNIDNQNKEEIISDSLEE
ncbi:MAG: hypothetical protein WC898_03850 [Candidatus Paceibacterota bacterium]|jgi:hypothetical protein